MVAVDTPDLVEDMESEVDRHGWVGDMRLLQRNTNKPAVRIQSHIFVEVRTLEREK